MWGIIKLALCFVFFIAINVSDIREYKIKNKYVLPLAVAGIIIGIIEGRLLDSILGMLIPIVLFILYALKMLGAGDIKAMCALGTILGARLCVYNIAFTFISGGVIAIIFMIFGKSARQRFSYLFSYIKSCFLARKLLSYDFGGNKKGRFRFSFAITAGFIITMVSGYLEMI